MKLEVRSSTVGSPDLVTFFVKGSPLPAGVPASEFDGAPSSTVLLREKNQRILVVGLGEKEKIEPDTLRRAAGAGIKQLLKLGSSEIALEMDIVCGVHRPRRRGRHSRQLQIRWLRQGRQQEQARRFVAAASHRQGT